MNVPFLEYEAIWRLADEVRNSEEFVGINNPPIDILYLVEIGLRFDVIDIPNLFADIRMDAAIVPDQAIIYVDRDAIEGWERHDSWVEKRLRFSVAHELGHYHMHQDFLNGIDFSDVNQFKHWLLTHRQNKRAEIQADEFAGRFLVPPDILRCRYDDFQRRMAEADPLWYDIEGMRTRLAKRLAPLFGVNHQVIETRFAREGIWPLQ